MRKNRKWIRTMLAGILVGITVCAMPVEASAPGGSGPGVPEPKATAVLPDVEIDLKGSVPSKDEDYVIKLQALDASYPMPEGSKDGVYTMTITGEGKKALPKIAYPELGIYKYKIWQKKGDNSKCTYDESVYHMTISVTNNKTMDGYSVVVALYKEGVTEKQEKVEFVNTYKSSSSHKPKPEPPKPEPLTPKTGDYTNVAMYAVLMSVSALALILLFVKKRRVNE